MLVSSLTGCSENEAKVALEQCKNDNVAAIEHILNQKAPLPENFKLYAPRKRRRTSFTRDEEYLDGLRNVMKNIDEDITKSIILRASSGSGVTQDHHEEMVQQNSCVQECQLPSVELEAEKQEIECQ